MMTPDDYADQRRNPHSVMQRHVSAVDIVFALIVMSGIASIVMQIGG